MEKATQSLAVVLVIGALIGAGSFYYWNANYGPGKTATTDAYNQGYSAGQTAGTQATVAAPNIKVEWAGGDTGVFTYTGYVDASGNVVAAGPTTAVDQEFSITNKGTTDLTNVVIALKNPSTGLTGLDTDLEYKYTTFTLDTYTITGINLYKGGLYTTYTIASLPAGATAYFDLYFNLVNNSKGDYQVPLHTYACDPGLNVYVGNSVPVTLEFTVDT